MFVVGGSSLWRYELQGLLGIGCDADTDFPECWRGFINLDVDMGVFKQGDGDAEATDASTDDRNTETFGGDGRW